MRTLSKGEFAAECKVTPGRVSQWLAEGKIGPDCLVGEGRNARIIVDRAKEQIGLRRDVGQSLANGLGTNLDAPAQPDTMALPRTSRDDVAHQIQIERLEGERRKNRREVIEEQVRLGRLVPADEVRSQMSRLARQVDDENGAMLADFASAVASRFQVPQRDVLHLLRQVRNEKKAAATERAQARAESLPETVTMIVDDEVAA